MDGGADASRRVDKGRNGDGKGFKAVKKLLPEEVANADGHGRVAGGQSGEVRQGASRLRESLIGKVHTGITTRPGQFGDDITMPPRAADKNGGGEKGRFR